LIVLFKDPLKNINLIFIKTDINVGFLLTGTELIEEYLEDEPEISNIRTDTENEDELTIGDGEAIFVTSRRGKKVLQYKGHRYRRTYESKNGIRWMCSVNKLCSASVYLNNRNEIISADDEHEHPPPIRTDHVDEEQTGKRSH
jgi:hypothetical protein